MIAETKENVKASGVYPGPFFVVQFHIGDDTHETQGYYHGSGTPGSS